MIEKVLYGTYLSSPLHAFTAPIISIIIIMMNEMPDVPLSLSSLGAANIGNIFNNIKNAVNNHFIFKSSRTSLFPPFGINKKGVGTILLYP